MYSILIFLLLNLFSQQQAEDPALKPIRDLFKGMEEKDSTLVRNAFIENAIMQSVVEGDNGTEIRQGDLNRFVRAIGTSTRQLAEPIWNIRIEKDGAFAQVYVDYALYVDGAFNHCGVDAFHLAEMNGEWKIMLVTDTRRVDNCVIPENVKAQYEK